MPELDYMVLADYVRMDAGVAHIMAAGIDTIRADRLPAAHNAHLAVRLTFGGDEVPGADHLLRLIFSSNDKVLSSVSGTLQVPDRPPGVPVHWRTGMLLNFVMTLPLPELGDYALALVLDERSLKEVDLRVVPAGGGPGNAEA
ncbi:hypothetical protein GCM10027589_05420 [Actinocorallia lasiicapitis]